MVAVTHPVAFAVVTSHFGFVAVVAGGTAHCHILEECYILFGSEDGFHLIKTVASLLLTVGDGFVIAGCHGALGFGAVLAGLAVLVAIGLLRAVGATFACFALSLALGFESV